MGNIHEPREDFIQRLELEIGREARRRQHQPARAPRWLPQSPFKVAAAAALLVVVSMGIGGAAVATAYEAQTNERRDVLMSTYERRADLARQRLDLAKQESETARRQAAVGAASQDAEDEARFKIVEAEAQMQSIDLQIREIRATGREPLNEVSAPEVAGVDYVGRRWEIDLSVPRAALELEKRRMETLRRRVDTGRADRLDLEVSRARIIELESALAMFQKKIDIRRQFLKAQLDAAVADLLVLKVEAEHRRASLVPRTDLAKRVVADMQTKVEIGTAANIDLKAAQIRLLELEIEFTKADIDLTLILKQLAMRGR